MALNKWPEVGCAYLDPSIRVCVCVPPCKVCSFCQAAGSRKNKEHGQAPQQIWTNSETVQLIFLPNAANRNRLKQTAISSASKVTKHNSGDQQQKVLCWPETMVIPVSTDFFQYFKNTGSTRANTANDLNKNSRSGKYGPNTALRPLPLNKKATRPFGA